MLFARCWTIIRTVATSARHRVVPQRAARGASEHGIAELGWESAASPRLTTQYVCDNVSLTQRACQRPALGSLAACAAVATFAADDTLRAVLLRERAALGEAVMQLTRAAWDEAEDPGYMWALGGHVSSKAPALAAVLLGDVEREGAQGGVALSSEAVASVANALVMVMARPSSSGSYIWHVPPLNVY